jgi:hypothetical protein
MRKILEQQNVVFDPETIELQIVQRSGVPMTATMAPSQRRAALAQALDGEPNVAG